MPLDQFYFIYFTSQLSFITIRYIVDYNSATAHKRTDENLFIKGNYKWRFWAADIRAEIPSIRNTCCEHSCQSELAQPSSAPLLGLCDVAETEPRREHESGMWRYNIPRENSPSFLRTGWVGPTAVLHVPGKGKLWHYQWSNRDYRFSIPYTTHYIHYALWAGNNSTIIKFHSISLLTVALLLFSLSLNFC